jgi:hypothetical protein
MIPCQEQRCLNCHEHFQRLRPLVKEILVSKHFKRDFPDFNTNLIVNCNREYFTRMHKFEKKIKENYIFRAVYKERHVVYAIDSLYRLIFLRVFSNFKEYKKFLENDDEIMKIIKEI